MSRTATRKKSYIVNDKEKVYLCSPAVEASYHYKFWFLKVNPKLLLPGFRKEMHKIIIVNGTRFGYGEFRHGGIPLPPYHKVSSSLFVKFGNIVRENLGLFCKQGARGYYFVKLGRRKFIILKHKAENGLTVCKVYYSKEGISIGEFAFDKDFKKVYPYPFYSQLYRTLLVIIGYMFDVVSYENLSHMFNFRVEVEYG